MYNFEASIIPTCLVHLTQNVMPFFFEFHLVWSNADPEEAKSPQVMQLENSVFHFEQPKIPTMQYILMENSKSSFMSSLLCMIN
jgi:hypothetical protein